MEKTESITPERIREIREQLGLTSKEFADMLDVPIDTANNWLYGRRPPTHMHLKTLLSLEREVVKRKRDAKISAYLANGALFSLAVYALFKGYGDGDDDETPKIKDDD